jgi:hypothetical protein
MGLFQSSTEDHEQVQIERAGLGGECVLDLGGVPSAEEVHVVEQDRDGLAARLGKTGGYIQGGRLPRRQYALPGQAYVAQL